MERMNSRLIDTINALRNDKVKTCNNDVVTKAIKTVEYLCNMRKDEIVVTVKSAASTESYDLSKYEVPSEFESMLVPRAIVLEAANYAVDLRTHESLDSSEILSPNELKGAFIAILNAFGKFNDPTWINVEETTKVKTFYDARTQVVVDNCYMSCESIHGWPVTINSEFAKLCFKNVFSYSMEDEELALINTIISLLKRRND